MRQKRVAVIHDFSGFGRCSLTVALPILSAMRLECCAVPTAVFSNHTGYESFYRLDLTAHLPAYFDEWEKRGVRFDGVLIGFLNSEAQLALVESFLRRFTTPETVVVLDPAMGDGGALYSGYPPELAARMHELAGRADVITPNLTEACILANEPYLPQPTEDDLRRLGGAMLHLGAKHAVISGLQIGEKLGNLLCEAESEPMLIARTRTGAPRCGTGDVFSAVVTGGILRGMTLQAAVALAADFICEAIRKTDAMHTPPQEGVCFEECLGLLVEASK